ncbi:MAG: TMEM175 family protein [Solirubrobacterales bacterium]
MKFERGSEEFTRVVTFSDAVFAIAMTLLVVGVDLPNLTSPNDVGDLADALGDRKDSIFSFFLSFAVIGRYWVAHHRFFSLLTRVDGGLLGINLVYLATIAFLPFPTDLLGNYFGNPLAVAVYAVNVAIISALEVALYARARHKQLLFRAPTRPVYRWGVAMSLSPVVSFLASVPVAFLAGSGAAAAVWLAAVPFQMIASRFEPEGAKEFLVG